MAKSKATKPAKRSAKGKPVAVKIDPALAAAWKKSLKTLEAAASEGQRAWDLKYETVGQIVEHDPPLFLAGGMATMTDFVKQYLPGEDLRSVQRNVRTAEYASPDEEEKYTTSKIDAAIDYLEATHGKPSKGRIPVDFAKLRIPTTDGTIAFATATVAQVRDAARVAATRTAGKGKISSKTSPVVKAVATLLPAEAKEVTVHSPTGASRSGGSPCASSPRSCARSPRPRCPSRRLDPQRCRSKRNVAGAGWRAPSARERASPTSGRCPVRWLVRL